MKVTLSAAMRARDVSRPRPEDEEAARKADAQPPPAAHRARPERADRNDQTEGNGRSAANRNGRGGRRKRR